ncbi:MAG TPA: HEAT repeat domain-containing protein, partial [Gemmatimonadota bacterium]|nr:HEAT repeat domain-containing protein [Gemmatimonadota bacterium]
LEPAVRHALAVAMAGEARARTAARIELRRLYAGSPMAVERCASDLLAMIEGREAERLALVVDDLGLVSRWTRRARSRNPERRREALERLGRLADGRGNSTLRAALADPEPSVRIEAARGLLRSERIADIERAFLSVTGETLLVRAILVEDLRPHAARLAEHAIPRVLSSPDPHSARVALEMIEAWQKGVHAPGVSALLRHPRPELRAQALRALPYVAGEADVVRETLTGLDDPDPEVRRAAANLAGRIGLRAAVPRLARLLHARQASVAVEAAYALARIGPLGWEALEREVRGPTGSAAAAALEALERVRTERLAVVRT